MSSAVIEYSFSSALKGFTPRERVEDHRYRGPGAADHRLAVADLRINGDAFVHVDLSLPKSILLLLPILQQGQHLVQHGRRL